MVARTRLGPSGTTAKPYGAFSHGPPAPVLRSYTETFTRLTAGTPGRPYGSFAKTALTEYDKAATASIIPRLAMGPVTDVDIDIQMSIIPRLVMSAFTTRGITARPVSIIPRLTMARGSTVVTGTITKTAAASVIPRLAMATTLLNKSVPVTMSVVPVLTSSAAIDTTSDELEATASVVPVLTMSASVAATTDSKAATASVVPVLRISGIVDRVNATLNHTVVMVAAPILRMSSSLQTAGEVDHIHITAAPYGRIRITKV
jgi:hypothetical protein